MLKQKYQFKNYNWILISAVLILSGMGVMFINSADSSYTSKQLVGLIFCAGIMLLLSVVNFNFVCGFSRILYLINIVLLVLVKLVGVKVNGAQRWINLGFTRLQPSELTKIIMIIFVAVYIQEHEEDFMEWKVLFKLALLCALPLFLVVIETNLSTTLDITFILMSVIFVGGLSGTLIKKCLKIIIPIIIPLGFLFIWYIQTPNQVLLHDYQVTRIMTFLEPSKYSIIIIANNAITITLPINPVSSPTTEKIKSVCCSDTNPVSDTVTSAIVLLFSPFPYSLPEPIASHLLISEWQQNYFRIQACRCHL